MIDRIQECATRFRKALDLVSVDTWKRCTVDAFPRGACGHCAELLARYLEDELGIQAGYVSARIADLVDGETHAWLEYDGIAIDISADQFDLPPVIVSRDYWLHVNATDFHRHPIIADHWFAQYAAPVWNEATAILASDNR